MNLKDLVSLVIKLSQLLPISVIMALFQVIMPLPTWSDKQSVSGWLGKLVISGPLGDAILAFVPTDGGVVPAAVVIDMDVTEDDVYEMVTNELEDSDTPQAFDAATIAQLVQLIMSLITMFRGTKS